MTNKIVGGAIVLAIIIGLVVFFWGTPLNENGQEILNENASEQTTEAQDQSTVEPGSYEVVAEQSEFNWAGKKPLIDGYINSGTIDVTSGNILVGTDEASGTFVLDMNTLDVGLTAKKPGQEGTLEQHLKGDGFFAVETYPTATFKITEVETTANSATTFEYNVTGDLTMKGITNEITFPATIYQDDEGRLHAEANTEIDRTKWDITVGSGSFFSDLGDNLIDDMVSISFSIVAEQ